MLNSETRMKLLERATPKGLRKHKESKQHVVRDFTQSDISDESQVYNLNIRSDKFWSYIGDDYLSLDDHNMSNDEEYFRIVYSVYTDAVKPFLVFAFFHSEEIIKPEIVKYSSTSGSVLIRDKETYKGWFDWKGKKYLFFEKEPNAKTTKISIKTNGILEVLSSDIINRKMVYNINIDEIISDFFEKNSQFAMLTNENNEVISCPGSYYYGSHSNRITVEASLGHFVESPYASFGPYYYFSNFDQAISYACVSNTHKPKEVDGKKLTRGETGIWEKGGIVRFAVFQLDMKLFRNQENSYVDQSLHTQNHLDNAFIKATSKLRDADGLWALKYNSAYHGRHTIEIDGKKIDLDPQLIVRDFDQIYSLDYLYVDTSKVEVLEGFHEYSYDNAELL
jgi:hypothetical protein